MKIAVFGAAGTIGRRVVAEALARDHQVTAVVRTPARVPSLHPAATPAIADAADLDAAIRAITGHDIVISATNPPPGREDDLVATTRTLLAAAASTGVRLLVVGGAATLTVPGTNLTVLDSPDHLSPAYRPIARACAAQLDACRADPSADWTYLSPPASLEPGDRTGTYRLGADELVVDAAGTSRISVEDLAVAVLDETERPKHNRTRFTVAY